MGVGVAKRLLRGRGILSFPGVFGLASVLAWFQCGLGFGLVWFAARNLITFLRHLYTMRGGLHDGQLFVVLVAALAI